MLILLVIMCGDHLAQLVFITLVLASAAFPDASIGTGEENGQHRTCPGGNNEGQQVELGPYWYLCQNGRLVPQGCMTPQRDRIAIGATFDSNSMYRMQCVLDTSENPGIVFKSCVSDGQERAVGEQWDDHRYYYTCVKEGDHLKVDLTGCVDNGKRVEVNGKVVKGSFVYQCKQSSNGTCSMCPVACQKNSKEYQIGENFELGQFVYTCTNTDPRGPLVIKRIGCVHAGQRLTDGDHFHQNDAVYECTVRKDSAAVRCVGCVERDDSGTVIERKLDCFWTEGKAPIQYQMTCKSDKSGKTAVKVHNSCIYSLAQGSYTVQPGCYQIADKTVVGCEADPSSATITLRLYQIDDIGQLTAKGMKNC